MAELLVALLADRPREESPLKAFEEALVEVARMLESNVHRDSSSIFEETLQGDPLLRAKSYIQSDRWTRVIAECFARRRSPDAQTQASDRLASATCVAIAQQIGNEWRRSTVGAEEAIREAFSDLRRMVSPADSAGENAST